ncbi:hypothetical protein L1987_42875 [Smallanthus sonchifolius]|uniref:Uncharacterized protein n=1 Tax=Smallanthus sonchifolius TaxID=185202 RepID=A0ACB9GJV7_9ASTR|nr:hypothetical protein L1987_42875 [Smallanthus sonchifolius]
MWFGEDTRETHQRAKIIAKTSAGVLSGDCDSQLLLPSTATERERDVDRLINRSGLSNSSTYLLVRFFVIQSVTDLLHSTIANVYSNITLMHLNSAFS